MVNRGKPSRACQACKARKIKCDETFPRCGACTKAGRVCLGIPMATTSRHATAVNMAKTPAASQPSPVQNVETAPTGSPSHARSKSAVVFETEGPWTQMFRGLSQPMEIIAVNCFINNFVLNPQRTHGLRSYFSELVNLLPYSRSSGSLQQAATAVALGSMSQFPEFQAMKARAPVVYGRALQLVGSDLVDPKMSKSNETLLSVMLLAIFEARVASLQSLSRYQHHLSGALMLLRHRGYEQFQDPRSLELFRFARNHVILNCIRTGKSLDEFETDSFWTDDLLLYEESVVDPAIYAFRIPSLRKRASPLSYLDHTPESVQEAQDLIKQALTIDDTLQSWYSNLPDEWVYTVKSFPSSDISDSDPDSDVWHGVVHIYADLWVVQSINRYRVFRLYLHELIIKCTTWLNPGQDEKEPYGSSALMQQIVDDICASVPFYLNYAQDGKMSSVDSQSREQMAAEANGAYALIWLLSVAIKVPCISTLQRTWLRRRMRIFADRYGFNQARVLSS